MAEDMSELTLSRSGELGTTTVLPRTIAVSELCGDEIHDEPDAPSDMPVEHRTLPPERGWTGRSPQAQGLESSPVHSEQTPKSALVEKTPSSHSEPSRSNDSTTDDSLILEQMQLLGARAESTQDVEARVLANAKASFFVRRRGVGFLKMKNVLLSPDLAVMRSAIHTLEERTRQASTNGPSKTDSLHSNRPSGYCGELVKLQFLKSVYFARRKESKQRAGTNMVSALSSSRPQKSIAASRECSASLETEADVKSIDHGDTETSPTALILPAKRHADDHSGTSTLPLLSLSEAASSGNSTPQNARPSRPEDYLTFVSHHSTGRSKIDGHSGSDAVSDASLTFTSSGTFHDPTDTGAASANTMQPENTTTKLGGYYQRQLQTAKLNEYRHRLSNMKRSRTKRPRNFSSKSIAIDDGDDVRFARRLDDYLQRRENQEWRRTKMNRRMSRLESGDEDISSTEADSQTESNHSNDEEEEEEEAFSEDVILDGGLTISSLFYRKLYPYQRDGVAWLWKLYRQGAGGILGDEMGLGKTIQAAVFLGALESAGRLRTALIATPASTMTHWVRELHKWHPPFRVMILHSSGSALEYYSREEVVRLVFAEGGIVITTYEGIRLSKDLLLPRKWDYVILDEGHKIRNPDAEITLLCKQFHTVNRLILTGTPIQNNLKELWSLFDFVFPGKLGTYPTFESELALPIKLGGFSNASPMQVHMAYKCALVLRDLVQPYLLRRLKVDVNEATKLPAKTEQVLFCRLTEEQLRLYRGYLSSKEVQDVLSQKCKAFRAIGILRKICNHPDLMHGVKFLHKGAMTRPTELSRPDDYGLWKKSGKMLVLDRTRQMLDILQQFVEGRQWKFVRLDGTTAIRSRQALIDLFNTDEHYFIFMLTTRAGGLGINLTGANRVLLYDPDWNPSTDTQARERAWRIGQTRAVTIYRLITTGTIEEKIYHRQIFKQFLSNKILKDPKQRRFFNVQALRDLFTLDHAEQSHNRTSDTSDLFPHGQVQTIVKRAVTEDQVNGGSIHKSPTKSQQKNQELSEKGKGEDHVDSHDKQVLRALFEGKDVKDAFQHDVIEKGGGVEERALIEYEASQVATHAADELKKSRIAIHRMGQVHLPTWTGRAGAAGRPGGSPGRSQPRFGATSRFSTSDKESPNGGVRANRPVAEGLSSKMLLNRIRERQGGGRGREGDGVESSTLDSSVVLIEDMHRFLQQAGPQGVTSTELVAQFAERIRGESAKETFRKMLRLIANRRRGRWCLKQEFQ